MRLLGLLTRHSCPLLVAASSAYYVSNDVVAHADSNVKHDGGGMMKQPSFGATMNLRKGYSKNLKPKASLDTFILLGGSSHPQLSEEISSIIGVPICKSTIGRFADGEVGIQIHDNLRGNDVYIIQSCAAPVSENIMELLLTISCARRSGAKRITAVIPYYGYKHHRRGSTISTKHQTRFLSSNAMDFAKMITEMGVDRVISVDLQRAGIGKESCFFDNAVPLENIVTSDYVINHIANTLPLKGNVIIVAPNAESVKKARNYLVGLQELLGSSINKIEFTAFIASDTSSGPTNPDKLEMMGNATDFANSDVIIVDDMIDTAGTARSLSSKFKLLGAKTVYVVASHGLFSSDAHKLIDESFINEVIVTNTLPLPANASKKIRQITIAPLIANVLIAEHFRYTNKGDVGDVDEFETDSD